MKTRNRRRTKLSFEQLERRDLLAFDLVQYFNLPAGAIGTEIKGNVDGVFLASPFGVPIGMNTVQPLTTQPGGGSLPELYIFYNRPAVHVALNQYMVLATTDETSYSSSPGIDPRHFDHLAVYDLSQGQGLHGWSHPATLADLALTKNTLYKNTTHIDDFCNRCGLYTYDAIGVIEVDSRPITVIQHPDEGQAFSDNIETVGEHVLVSAATHDRVFRYDKYGSLIATYRNPDFRPGTRFGAGMSGFGESYVVIGDPAAVAGRSSGQVYVFDGLSGEYLFDLEQAVEPGSWQTSSDQFGASMVFQDGILLVSAAGAHLDNGDNSWIENAGLVEVYDPRIISAANNKPIHTIRNSEPMASDFFGTDVAIAGGDIVVLRKIRSDGPARIFHYEGPNRREYPPKPQSTFGLNRWWAEVGSEPIDVTWTVNVPASSAPKHVLDIDFQQNHRWRLSDDATISVGGVEVGSINPVTGRAFVGRLVPGIQQITINGLIVPGAATVEEVVLKIVESELFKPDDVLARLDALFIADWPDLDPALEFTVAVGNETSTVEAIELANLFAPKLHFNQREVFATPFDVGWTLEAARARGNGDMLFAEGRGNAKDWIDLSFFHRDLDRFRPLLFSGNSAWVQQTAYASILCNNHSPTCEGATELAINYYYFYPMSNWQQHGGRNIHQGDLEGIVVFLVSENGVWKPNLVSYSQHTVLQGVLTLLSKGGQTFKWESVRDSSHRLHGYVGLGGHATYAAPGMTAVKPFGTVESHDGLGPKSDTRYRLQLLPRVSGGENVPGWLKYSGHFGHPDLKGNGSANAFVRDDEAPRGPAFQAVIGDEQEYGLRWLYPWQWVSNFSKVREEDFDFNGTINAADIDLLYGALGSSQLRFDLTNDGTVDRGDLDRLLRDILNIRYGDRNLDGRVTFFRDYLDTAANLGRPGGWRQGDFNGNGIIDQDDLDTVFANMGLPRPLCEGFPRLACFFGNPARLAAIRMVRLAR